MVVLIIVPVILQTDINVIMLSIGGQGGCWRQWENFYHKFPMCSRAF